MKTDSASLFNKISGFAGKLKNKKDIVWIGIYLAGMVLLLVWDMFYLNKPAFSRVLTAYFNSFFAGLAVIIFAALLGWGGALLEYYTRENGNKILRVFFEFVINLIKSIPQIIGILVGYIILTILISHDVISGKIFQLLWMSGVISVFVFMEVKELLDERIEYFRKSDFFDAMICCGIKESHIINYEIFWKNSRDHIIQKLISLLGITIFLQCSIDFIISVGLTTGVSLSGFPDTLGSVLAKLDSKQDILAIGNLITDPGYLPKIFTVHLQGINIAFLIIFSLLCLYKISNGYLRRKDL